MLFVDLSGLTGLAEWMEAEHYADLLAQLSTLYEQVVPRHGGAVARIQGDGMLAILAIPRCARTMAPRHRGGAGAAHPGAWSAPPPAAPSTSRA